MENSRYRKGLLYQLFANLKDIRYYKFNKETKTKLVQGREKFIVSAVVYYFHDRIVLHLSQPNLA